MSAPRAHIMIATQIRQKDAFFYFASYPVRSICWSGSASSAAFTTRRAARSPRPQSSEQDDVAPSSPKSSATTRRSNASLSRAKVRAIRNFYETAITQPPIPGTVLLFTPQKLRFEAWTDGSGVGRLQEPEEKFLIIDGQHRLAALQFFHAHPSGRRAQHIHVPCVIFDGRSEDFATEMFVIINSTPTRINKSHLVDLYERVSWAEPDRRFAAHIAEMLYSESDSPLRYRINRLGGRSKQEKWILQAELFNEIHRWTRQAWRQIETGRHGQTPARPATTPWRGIFSKPPRKCGARPGATRVSWSPSR